MREVGDDRDEARLTRVERVAREGRRGHQRERAGGRNGQEARQRRSERRCGAADERDRHRDLHHERRTACPAARRAGCCSPPRNAKSSEKNSRCASGSPKPVAEQPPHDEPEDRCAARRRAGRGSTASARGCRSTSSGTEAPSTEVGLALPAPTANARTPSSRWPSSETMLQRTLYAPFARFGRSGRTSVWPWTTAGPARTDLPRRVRDDRVAAADARPCRRTGRSPGAVRSRARRRSAGVVETSVAWANALAGAARATTTSAYEREPHATRLAPARC